MNNRKHSDMTLMGASALAMTCAIALPTAALAQAAPSQTAPSQTASPGGEQKLQEVVVTASRVQRSGFTAPTPTTVESGEVMRAQGLVNVADLLNQVPAIHGSFTPQSATFGFNSTGGNFLNLRNLGNGSSLSSPTRTLVLIDSERVVPSTAYGAIDLNLIPTIMVDRTEVVTGGASAGYGSDAVAGVVNLILKQRMTGFQSEASYGVSTYGDDKTGHLAAAGGGSLFGGHFLLGAEYDKSDGVPPPPNSPRGWAAAYYGFVTGAGNVRYPVSNLQFSQQTYGGIVTSANAGATAVSQLVSGPLHGIAFQPNGQPYNFAYGNLYGNATGSSMSGGSNQNNFNNDSTDIVIPSERFSALGRYAYDFNDHLHAKVSLIYGFNRGNHPSVIPRDPIAGVKFVIASTNPFIPAAVKSIMTANGYTSITLGRSDQDLGPYQAQNNNQTYQTSLDFNGDFDAFSSNWTWDAHAGYGHNKLTSALANLRIDPNFQNAITVVTGANGVAACASAAAVAAGCLPFNPFGQGQSDPAAKKYFTGTSQLWQNYTRQDYTFNLRGNPFSTWAGPVSIATGFEYRQDSLSQTSDPLSYANAYDVDNNQPLSGSINVAEAYGETVVPLLSNLPFAKEVDFNGAAREAHYNLSGNSPSWKLGGVWQVNGDLRFRVSDSRDTRAPNVAELFLSQQVNSSNLSVIPPGQTTAVLQQTTTVTQGNHNLTPEIADTISYGFGYQPAWLTGFRFSLDYYDIRINNAIATPTAQQIVSNCQSGQTAYCASLKFDASGFATEFLQPLNINALKTSGFDIDVGYQSALSRFHDSLPGVLGLNWLGNYTSHLIYVQNNIPVDRAGEVGGGVISTGPDAPHWVWDANANYRVGPASFNAHVHYVGGGVLDATALPGQPNAGLMPFNSVPSRTYLNLGVQYDLPTRWSGNAIQLFGTVNNVANVAPPNWGRDISDDLIGRFFTVGFRLKL